MPNITGLLLADGDLKATAPVEARIKLSKTNPSDAIKVLLASKSDPVASTCKIGLIYSTGGHDANPLATAICHEFSGKAKGEIHGRCFVVGEDEKGAMISLPKESVEQIANLYQRLTGVKPAGLSVRKAKKENASPKKPRKDIDCFRSKFYKARSEDLKNQNLKFDLPSASKEAVAAWAALSAEEKAPYMAEAAQDKARYDREMAEWVVKNPPKPLKARTATWYYNQSHDKEGRVEYKTLPEEEKKAYEAKAEEDKKRYDEELAKFKQHCEETGKNFDDEIAPKKRAKPAEKKAKAKADAPKAKKQKGADGAPKASKETKGPAKKKAAAPKKQKKDEAPKKKRKAEEEEEEEEEDEQEDEEEEEEGTDNEDDE